MLNKEEFEALINSIKDRLDETTSALISEDLLSIVSNYTLALDEISKNVEEIETLKADKDELLKVNGRLFQKVGFDKEEKEDAKPDDSQEEEISIDEIINEKGELI